MTCFEYTKEKGEINLYSIQNGIQILIIVYEKYKMETTSLPPTAILYPQSEDISEIIKAIPCN